MGTIDRDRTELILQRRMRRTLRPEMRADDDRAIDPGRRTPEERAVAPRIRAALRSEVRTADEVRRALHSDLRPDRGMDAAASLRLRGREGLLLTAAAGLACDALAGNALATDRRGAIEAGMYRALRSADSDRACSILNGMRASRRALRAEHRALEAGRVARLLVRRAGSELRTDRGRSRRASRSDERALRLCVCVAGSELRTDRRWSWRATRSEECALRLCVGGTLRAALCAAATRSRRRELLRE